MGSFENGNRLNGRQSDALYEAWEMISFIEGATKPKLEVDDVDTTPFLDGLYRTIQEVKKRLDVVMCDDDEEPPVRKAAPESGSPKEANPMKEAELMLIYQGAMIKQLSEDLHCKADASGRGERENELRALAVTLALHRSALSEISAIVEGVKRAA